MPLPISPHDDSRLSNPLARAPTSGTADPTSASLFDWQPRLQERLERLGTGWMGVIFEFEGVLLEDCAEDHKKARIR